MCAFWQPASAAQVRNLLKRDIETANLITKTESGVDTDVATDLSYSINQKYIIHAAAAPIDLSRLELRYDCSIADRNSQKAVNVYFDNAAIQMVTAPFYLDISNAVHAATVKTAENNYISITFQSAEVIQPDSGSLRIMLRIANADWSPIDNIEETGLSVIYDGIPKPPVTPEPLEVFESSEVLENPDTSAQEICSAPVNPYDMPMNVMQIKPDVNYGTTTKISFYSSVIGTYRKCNVITPANYSPDKTYPVLYLLHGIGGTEDEWLCGGCATIIGNMIAEGTAKEMIVVVPNARASKLDGFPSDFLENIATCDKFIDVLKADLIPYINIHYSVKTGPEHTAIAGLSMGGRESLFIGFSMSETFGYIGAFSPAPGLLPDATLDYCGQFLPREFKIPQDKPVPKMILMCNGDSDSVVHTIPDYYHSVLIENGVKHLWYTMHGDHNFDVWDNGLYQFVKRIF